MQEISTFKLFCGDDIEIHWDGNVWIAPTSGAQYAHESDAMREELRHYLRSCGEDVEEELCLYDHGQWGGAIVMKTITMGFTPIRNT